MNTRADVRMPCGRKYYCGRKNCPHAAFCMSAGGGGTGEEVRAEAPKQGLKPPLAEAADLVFLYDGSMPGFMCCVYESVYSHLLPAAIWRADEAQPTLFETRTIPTDPARAKRVQDSIPAKISPRALELVQQVFFTCLEEKELAVLRFLLLGYRQGRQTPWMYGHPDVAPLLKAEQHMMGEAHLLKGFVRFSDYDGVLAATISPKNFVLPFLQKHFVTRYSGEDFLIFDKTHRAALIYQNRKSRIVPLEGISFPQVSEEEQRYRSMWKQFYNTIAIEARENPRCRMTNMPKRYWENMLEVSDLL